MLLFPNIQLVVIKTITMDICEFRLMCDINSTRSIYTVYRITRLDSMTNEIQFEKSILDRAIYCCLSHCCSMTRKKVKAFKQNLLSKFIRASSI